MRNIKIVAPKEHRASRLHWLELEYLRWVLSVCEDYYELLRSRLSEADPHNELLSDMLWEDYRRSINYLLYMAEDRGCSRHSISQIESWLLQ